MILGARSRPEFLSDALMPASNLRPSRVRTAGYPNQQHPSIAYSQKLKGTHMPTTTPNRYAALDNHIEAMRHIADTSDQPDKTAAESAADELLAIRTTLSALRPKSPEWHKARNAGLTTLHDRHKFTDRDLASIFDIHTEAVYSARKRHRLAYSRGPIGAK